MSRLFLALPLTAESRQKVAEAAAPFRSHSEIRPVAPENYHITLRFIGEVTDETEQSIRKALQSFDAPTGEIDATIRGFGAFPQEATPATYWAGIVTDMIKLKELYRLIAFSLEHLGIQKKKERFIPHITVARVRRNRDVPETLRHYVKESREKEIATERLDRIVLYRSELLKSGAHYTPLEEISL